MPKIVWRTTKVKRIYENRNQYGVRQIGERDLQRARIMIETFESYATFDEMMPNLKQFRLHKLTDSGDEYSVDIGPKNRITFERTAKPDEVMVLSIDDPHTRGSRR